MSNRTQGASAPSLSVLLLALESLSRKDREALAIQAYLALDRDERANLHAVTELVESGKTEK